MLKIELLPCHISVAVAEKIFFIGESIQLFEHERRLESQGAVLKDKETEFYTQLVSSSSFYQGFKAGLSNDRLAGHIRPAKYLNVDRELYLMF